MIDRQTVDRIMDAANIVDVVSEFVTLRKSGASYKGLCPFHDDSTPSFYVSPSRNICKCFSCGKGCTPVGFIMEHEQMTYPEALRWLANKYHIEIRERELTNEERQAESARESMFIVNEWAAKFFHNALLHTDEGKTYGMQYFRSRGIRDDIIEKFQLGYCPNRYDAMATAAKAEGYQAEFLIKTGLCYPSKENAAEASGSPYRSRVIFPWLSVSGKVVAFGGRKLDAATKGVQQKYVNSPDSEIYHKERELYGIYQAKRAIAKEDCVYMVEGYTDVIAMHQCGIENVVANSGTALSYHQIRTLHRFTSNIVLLYDGDAAGIHAAMRGTDMLLSEGMNVKVLLLPDGDDPDSFSRKHTATDFRQYIADHQTDFIVFKIKHMMDGQTDPVKRSEAVNSVVQSIAVIKNQILRDTYIHECAMRTGMAEQTLIATMNKMIHEAKRSLTPDPSKRSLTPDPSRRGEGSGQGTAADGSVPQGAVQNASQEANHSTPLSPARGVGGEASLRGAGGEAASLLLTQAVIRHGEEVIIRDVENEATGERISLNVAQYISYDLGLDNLQLTPPLYQRILDEAVAHSSDPGFKAEDYFLHHEDMDISRLAVQMSIDPVPLAESLKMRERENGLRDRVMHLVLDFRMDYVEHQLKQLRQQVSLMSNNVDAMMQTMAEIKRMQEIRNVLAKRLGNDIVV